MLSILTISSALQFLEIALFTIKTENRLFSYYIYIYICTHTHIFFLQYQTIIQLM